jgi:ubiquinone/menaquinone biosynthesis C-methylase UbiE
VIATLKNYVKQHLFHSEIKEKSSVEAYDIWSKNYDEQPGNLMLDLDEKVFSTLLANLPVHHKNVADIGCGTGRHWPKLLSLEPVKLTGFDVSSGMLQRLEKKFPGAQTYQITDNLFKDIPAKTYDTIVSTLTVAHIKNIGEALKAWCRIIKTEGDIVITDFHPSTLAYGGKRTFKHDDAFIAVQNFVHLTSTIKEILRDHHFKLVTQEELTIDESVKHYYEKQNALHVYESYQGFPIIYGMHFRRRHDTK